MRLLIVTQNVDRNDPILGFFHRWLEEFSKNCEQVIVIGQSVGDHHLPANVMVLSLGKENGMSRWRQVFRYRWLLWTHRRKYDAIFVHMTPIWGVFAWRMVLFFRKPLYLWYEARGARWPLKIAVRLCTKVFSASKAGMPLVTSKSVITGHGIDTALFSPISTPPARNEFLTVGRITASKHLASILHVMSSFPSSRLRIAGTALTDADQETEKILRADMMKLGLMNRVDIQAATHSTVIHLLRRSTIFLHASATSLDKALLEAMSCGCLVVSCADVARGLLPPECFSTPEGMAEKAKALLVLSPGEQDQIRRKLRQTVMDHHSLQRLIPRLVAEMQ